MIVNGKSLLELAPIKNMEKSKKTFNGLSYGLSEAGYDIRLKQSIVFIPNQYYTSPFQETLSLMEPSKIYVDGGDMLPGNFCLASAIEEFQMPPNLLGVVHDKSSNVRKGIQVFNTVIEPGWKGFLTLEIAFHGSERIHLEAGTPIAQVIFHELKEEASYNGKYQNQPDKPVGAIYE